MEIGKARPGELETILDIYSAARQYMRSQGNLTQWTGGYPSRELVEEDIRRGACFVCREAEEILGVFCCFPGPDPTYGRICDGAWPDDGPYGVIHRIAVRVHRRGVATACFDWALARYGRVRIDTHRDNIPMQRALDKNGFVRCGTIFLENGDPRIAYQKMKNEENET